MDIGIIGGGNVGCRLAHLLTDAGHRVWVGVRQPDGRPTDGGYTLVPVEEAAERGKVIILALPYTAMPSALPPLAERLTGKIVVDATNPLGDDWSPLPLGEVTSGAEEIVRWLPDVRVVKAFKTVFADVMTPEHLDRDGRKVTLFIAGDDEDANTQIANLGRDVGFAPLVTGPLRNARYLEAMAHLNIAIAVGQGGGTNAAFLYDQAIG